MRFLPPILLFAACRGPTDPPPDTGDGEPGTTTASWDGFQPASFGMTSARFAVDADGNATSWSDPGSETPNPVTVVFSIGDPTVAVDGLTATNACTVTFVHPGPIAQTGLGSSAWATFLLPDDATASTTCGAYDLPPRWADPEALFAAWTFGFGVGGLDPAVRAKVQDQLGGQFPEVEPFLAGGGFHWDGLTIIDGLQNEAGAPLEDWLDGWVDTAVTYAYEVDDALVEVREGGYPVLVEASTLEIDGGLARARYEVQGTTMLQPANLLFP